MQPRPRPLCTAPIIVLYRAFVRSTALPKRSRASGVAPSMTRPRRSCFSVKHPARSAPQHRHSQLRTFTRNFAPFPHHVSDHELCFLTTEVQLHFSVPLEQRACQSPKSIVGRAGAAVAQLGVSRRGRRFVVSASRSLSGAIKHRTAVVFCVSVASRHPSRV